MSSRKRTGLRLETLEDRWVPASISYNGSSLYIYNLTVRPGNTSSLTVTEGAGNTFQVLDGAANNGSYAVSGSITIQGNNAKDTITVKVTPGVGLAGGLNIRTGNGASSVAVDGTAPGGLVLGNTSINLGLGGGTVNLGTTNGLQDRGNISVSSTGTANNTVNVGNAGNASTFSGNQLVFSNFNNVTLGAGAADSFRGNVFVSDPSNPNPGTVTLGKAASVLGNFSITGGTGNETVNINGAAVLGQLSLNLQNGTNALVFGSGGATTVGSLNFTSGNGNTAFTASGLAGTALTVLNNAQLSWGNGANVFGSSAGFVDNGSFTLTNGNGSLDVAANTFRGSVLGSLTVNTGNGNNSFTLDGTNGAVGGGAFNYTGGNGGNNVTVNNVSTNFVNLNVHMGSNPGTGAAATSNVFTIGAGTTAGTLGGLVSWGVPSLTVNGNAFVNNGYVWQNAITLINAPA